ncbi:MAG: flagellar biosynthetic protein FliR [Phycisphaerae bacterium]|nr:flagellar biosynthetic protein FliR [Phycisphaerae bacterium]
MNALDDLIPLALQLPSLLMVIFRVGGIMIMAPFFGSASVPPRVKVALALVLSLAIWPALPHNGMLPVTLPAIITGVLAELLVGLTMGFVVTIVFSGLQIAGLAISQQMGISLADVFNPDFNESADVVSVLYYWIGLVIFLAIGGHRMLLGSLVDSFGLIPPGGFVLNERTMALVTGAMTASFVMAFKVSLPVVLALFMTSVAMGLINRTVPQMNILTVGFAVRSSLGMLLAAATLVAVMGVFTGAIEHAMGQLNSAISGWVARA